MTLIIRLPYLAHLNVSSLVCNASIPVLVKTTHVIDKLLSVESTVLTKGEGGTRYLSG